MNTAKILSRLACVLLATTAFAASPGTPPPSVLTLRKVGNNLMANFQGITTQQLVLEAKSGSGWKPLSTQYGGRGITTWTSRTAKSGQGTVTFPIPSGYALDQLRIVSSPAKFPMARLRGPKSFAGSPAPASRLLSPSTRSNLGMTANLQVSDGVPGPESLVESDIWKVSGNRLYFFNQYRGLQLFDLTDPANPIRTGGLRLPARGEQFYLLNASGSQLALLGRENSESGSGGVIYLVSVENGIPTLTNKVKLAGEVVDSRLSGSRLYVTTFEWGWSVGSLASFSPRITVSGYDLSNPRQPVNLPSLPLSGYWPTMQGDSQTLLIAAGSPQNWSQSSIHVVDIATPTGEPRLIKTLQTKGAIADKFKMRVSQGIVTAISNDWEWNADGSQRSNWVENFSARDSATEPLAQLELEEARGESLHATRFDGNKLYVVTFESVDPLFVVDLSNPSAPAVLGHIEIPGWSTYLEPYGNRLLAVGVEDGKVTVSVFDVSNPAQPALASRVALGEGNSWSEAHYDERAAGFFPDQGVLLVPYQSWDSAGWHNATAVVKLDTSGLNWTTSIQHEFTARRAAFTGSHILSISGQELIVADAKDLSQVEPEIQLSLAWQVDRVLPFGSEHLIQIEDGEVDNGFWGWGFFRAWSPAQRRQTMIRISKANSPDDLIEEIDLGPGRIIGTLERNGYLYLGQYVKGSAADPGDVVRTWVFSLNNAPELTEVSHADSELADGVSRLNLEQAQGLWPDASTLVWHIPSYAFFFGGPIYVDDRITIQPVTVGDVTVSSLAAKSSAGTVSPAASISLSNAASQPAISASIWRGGANDVASVVCPVRVTNPQAPSALPTVVVKGQNGAPVRSEIGVPSASAGFVFLSYLEDSGESAKPIAGQNVRSRAWLQVLDFRSSGSPVVRDRVSIPGELATVAEVDDRGAILLTVDPGRNTFRACAYDGSGAFQMDTWSSPSEVSAFTPAQGAGIFLGRSAPNAQQISSLRFDSSSGRFRVAASLNLPHAVYELAARGNLLLASQWGKVSATPISATGTFGRTVTLDTDANLWIQLARSTVRPGLGVLLPAGAYGVEFLVIPPPVGTLR
jgi:uncharacterized secreted protein with C-terminal beta-propeller domain